jgi:tRNA nucleotidyltransferase (CCA-adding enzyme)
MDIDIVVEKKALRLARVVKMKKKGRLILYPRFGTATLVLPQGRHVDFATARRESYAYPGALPEVKFDSIEEDLVRRDFTINTLALSLDPGEFGKILDPGGGLNDLNEKKIRVIHEMSFLDDPTRILRAVRFEQRFGFEIEGKTLYYLRSALKQNALNKLKGPRLWNEFSLIFKEPSPEKVLARFEEFGALRFIHPGMKFDSSKTEASKEIGKGYKWFRAHFPQKTCQIDKVYLFNLLKGLNPADVKKMGKIFSWLKEDVEQAVVYLRDGSPAAELLASKERLLPSQGYSLLKPFCNEALLVLWAENRNLRARTRIAEYLRHYQDAKLKSNGEDLKALGLHPGPHFANVLQKLLQFKLDRGWKTKEEEIKFLRHNLI